MSNVPSADPESPTAVPVAAPHRCAVVVMAGGRGSRMGALTRDEPKALLPVAGRALIDHVIGGVVRAGFDEVHVAVGYRGEQLRAHLAEGQRLGIRVQYLDEPEPRGTAGALQLLPATATDDDVLVINGDVVAGVDFARVLAFHRARGATATVCVAQHVERLPYGEVTVEGDELLDLVEKPAHDVLVNAGIYVLGPRASRRASTSAPIDMSELVQALLADGERVCAYRLEGPWLDVGRPEDLARADALLRER